VVNVGNDVPTEEALIELELDPIVDDRVVSWRVPLDEADVTRDVWMEEDGTEVDWLESLVTTVGGPGVVCLLGDGKGGLDGMLVGRTGAPEVNGTLRGI
jgi:hypothetical protein